MLIIGAGRDGEKVAKHILSHRSRGGHHEHRTGRTRESAWQEIAGKVFAEADEGKLRSPGKLLPPPRTVPDAVHEQDVRVSHGSRR
jgi:hypothetical protein